MKDVGNSLWVGYRKNYGETCCIELPLNLYAGI